jgi:hypothetical protein
MWIRFWDYARKAGVAVCFIAAAVATSNLLPDPWDKVVTAIVAVGGYFGVYHTENKMPESGRTLPAGSDPLHR